MGSQHTCASNTKRPTPILQQSDVKCFYKNWRTDHDQSLMIGTISIYTDRTVSFMNAADKTDKILPISAICRAGECTINIHDMPVTLFIISYHEISATSCKVYREVAFLLDDPQQIMIWMEVLHYQSNQTLEMTNYFNAPECPICLMSASDSNEQFTYLINCKHVICQSCLFNYIKSQMKDASKYPMRCFNFKCNQLLHFADVQFAFDALPNAPSHDDQAHNNEDNKDVDMNDNNASHEHVQLQHSAFLQFVEQNNRGVICVCGQPMNKASKGGILCNHCLLSIESNLEFYRCSEPQHPNGYYLCMDCSEVRQQTHNLDADAIPVCECGDSLAPMMPSKCYGGGSKQGIVCNECQHCSQDLMVWHCMKTFCDAHESGYDLCIECAARHTPLAQKRAIEEEKEKAVKEEEERKAMESAIQQIKEQCKPNTSINYAVPTSRQDYLAIYNRFSVLCALPSSARNQCPRCEIVFFGEPRLKSSDHLNWRNENMVEFCANKQCGLKFGHRLFHARLRCILCGQIYCQNCRINKLKLTAGSDAAQTKYLAQFKVRQYRSNLSIFNNIGEHISNLLKTEQEVQNKELELEQQQLQRTTSDEKKQIIESALIDCCYQCWLQFYRGVCSECGYEFCSECRQKWHPYRDCADEQKFKEKEAENDQLNQAFFQQHQMVRCPRCGIVIEKTSGCNSIQHKCKKENEAEYTTIYVCHCCGEYLKDHDHEKENGQNHFPKGPFELCRKMNSK